MKDNAARIGKVDRQNARELMMGSLGKVVWATSRKKVMMTRKNAVGCTEVKGGR
jgi:hypothetical protein